MKCPSGISSPKGNESGGRSKARATFLLRKADPEKIAFIILRKKAKPNNSKSVAEDDMLFAVIGALEWLHRQVIKHMA